MSKNARNKLVARVDAAPVVAGLFLFLAFAAWFVTPWLALACVVWGASLAVKLIRERRDVRAALSAPDGEVVVWSNGLTINSPCLRSQLSIDRSAVMEITPVDRTRGYLPSPAHVLDLGRFSSGSSVAIRLLEPVQLTPRRLPQLRRIASRAVCTVDVIRLPINGGTKLNSAAAALGWPTA